MKFAPLNTYRRLGLSRASATALEARRAPARFENRRIGCMHEWTSSQSYIANVGRQRFARQSRAVFSRCGRGICRSHARWRRNCRALGRSKRGNFTGRRITASSLSFIFSHRVARWPHSKPLLVFVERGGPSAQRDWIAESEGASRLQPRFLSPLRLFMGDDGEALYRGRCVLAVLSTTTCSNNRCDEDMGLFPCRLTHYLLRNRRNDQA